MAWKGERQNPAGCRVSAKSGWEVINEECKHYWGKEDSSHTWIEQFRRRIFTW